MRRERIGTFLYFDIFPFQVWHLYEYFDRGEYVFLFSVLSRSKSYALFTMLLYMPMYFWRNLKIFSMTLLQPDAMSVTEYNNINTR